tara:strand:+ start:14337 stop:14612 length:276 start_codon:yes stop_codon:yes gene_type:complete
MDIDFLIAQITEVFQHPNARFNLDHMLRDILTGAVDSGESVSTEILRQRTEEVDSFRKSAEFWRGEFIKQQDSLKHFEPKAVEMKIIELDK